MKLKEEARITYAKFSLIDGNKHIAKQFSIQIVLNIVTDFKINKVLELGLGIGSISDAVLNYVERKNFKVDYSGTEDNDFCLNALKNNVDKYQKLTIYKELDSIPTKDKFDLVIIDGQDKSLSKIKEYVNKSSLVFIENGRDDQVAILKKHFPQALSVRISSNYKNLPDGPYDENAWSGGGTLIFLFPNIKYKIYWFKQKVRTFIIWKKRKYLS